MNNGLKSSGNKSYHFKSEMEAGLSRYTKKSITRNLPSKHIDQAVKRPVKEILYGCFLFNAKVSLPTFLHIL